jgi:hypothetical protein
LNGAPNNFLKTNDITNIGDLFGLIEELGVSSEIIEIDSTALDGYHLGNSFLLDSFNWERLTGTALAGMINTFFNPFLNERGCGYVLAYFKERRNSGERLSEDSSLIRANVEHKLKSLKANKMINNSSSGN